MFERDEEWDKEQIYIETRVPADHSKTAMVFGHLLPEGEWTAEEKMKRNRIIALILLGIYLVIAWIVVTQPPLSYTHQAESGNYKANRISKTILMPDGEILDYTSDSLKGVVHFTVQRNGERILGFNTHYGAKSVDLGRFEPMTDWELGIYHALMRVTKDFQHSGGDYYQYTGWAKSSLLRGNSVTGALGLLYMPPFLLGVGLLIWPYHMVDVLAFLYISNQKLMGDENNIKDMRLGGGILIGFSLFGWLMMR